MRVTTIVMLACLAFISSACGSKGSSTSPTTEPNSNTVATTGAILDFVTKVGPPGSSSPSTPSSGSAPAPGTGPVASVSGPTTITAKDAVFTYTLTSSSAFQKIFVTVPGKTGFIEVSLASPVLTQTVSVFFNTLPSSLTLQFQVASAGGAVGPVATLSLITASTVSANIVMTVSPDPIPWSGKTCTVGKPIDPATGCIYETTMDVQETGGVKVTFTQYQATWTFGGPATPRVTTLATLPSTETQIFGGETVKGVPVRISCSTPTCSAAIFGASAGTLSITITGTDENGKAVSFKSKDFVLLPGL